MIKRRNQNMLVSESWREQIAKDIIYEFELLLCNNDTKINNLNSEENKFETEYSYINEKDYNELKEKIIRQLRDFEDDIEEARVAQKGKRKYENRKPSER